MMEVVLFLAYFKLWDKEKWKQVALIALIGILLFIPAISVFFDRANDFQAQGSWVSEVKLIDLWINLIKLMNNEFTLFTTIGIILLLYTFGRKNKGELKESKLKYFGGWFLGTYVLMFLLSVFIQPIFFVKYLQFLTIPLFFLIVASVEHFKFDGIKQYLPLTIVVPFLVSFKPVPDINRDTAALLAYVKEQRKENSIVYYCPPHYDLTLAYHYDRAIFSAIRNTDSLMTAADFIPVYTGVDVDVEAPYKQIIYIDFDAKLLYPDNQILEKLDDTFTYESAKTFKGDFHVYIYRN